MQIRRLSKRNEGRTKKSARNISFGLIGQMVGLIVNFISRKVFVMFLSAEYLGLNGLFSNILSMLSLAELGIGTAIVYSLYKPLAENNIEEIKSLMALFQKAYRIIGGIVFVVGAALTPFLSFFVKDMPDLPMIRMIYFLYVINSAVSYLYTYRRSLIIADQNRYIATTYRYVLFFFQNIFQILVLFLFRSFIAYLLIQILFTVLENILVTRAANRMYPYLLDSDIQKLPSETVSTIKKNVSAMICHKIGGVVVTGTDNLLISKLVDVVSVGFYSNYLLITNALHIVYGVLLDSMTASYGNLNVSADNEYKETVFYRIFFGTSWIYGWSSICLLCLCKPFIVLWLGNSFLLPNEVVYWIVVVFYITGMRKAVLLARSSMGLYWNDRYKPLAESIINLVVSIILGKKYGISGIIIGTFVSSMTTCFWIEPYVLYKYGFHAKLRKYFLKYMIYTVVTFIGLVLTVFMMRFIPDDGGILTFGLRLVVCMVVPNAFYLLIYRNTEECKFYLQLAKSFGKKKFKKLNPEK